jgi:hypothetical protein
MLARLGEPTLQAWRSSDIIWLSCQGRGDRFATCNALIQLSRLVGASFQSRLVYLDGGESGGLNRAYVLDRDLVRLDQYSGDRVLK